ncbi:hypothetical protein [Rubellimicrobium roseum]|uniref:Leucine-rich repeat domain-containing protein n=1 Tax=Rubellimicrobium roseum TaxID=687525 RepID=A0A5C4N8P8_9RHOB|nr:hypothetical protein [Rubellimicrobium roseum]TNC61417.1 hypothetical protein FHG71_21205 [Rubellimicrobium roseum]
MTDRDAVTVDQGHVLNNKVRGHVERDWEDWRTNHFFGETADIPLTATRAWIARAKLNYRGVGRRTALRHLIATNVDQFFLDEISQLDELERLELEWPMVADNLAPLLGLRRLRFLSLDSPRKITDFTPLLQLPALRTLLITNPKRMASLDWLRDAHHLEVIGIEGGMWSPYKIPSLKPLAGLRSLRAFLGVSTTLADKQLMPLADCPNLEFLKIARVAPREQFERLHAVKPNLVCTWFRSDMWR